MPPKKKQPNVKKSKGTRTERDPSGSEDEPGTQENQGTQENRDSAGSRNPTPSVQSDDGSLPETLSVAQEQEVADWTRDNPVLYDKTHKHYSKKGAKQTLQADKAKAMGISSVTLDKFLRNMRTQYGKLKKLEKSGSAAVKLTHRKKWILNSFNFLDEHLQIRAPMRNMGSSCSQAHPVTSGSDDDGGSAVSGRESPATVFSGRSSVTPTVASSVSRPHPLSLDVNRRGVSQPPSKKTKASKEVVDDAMVKLCDKICNKAPQNLGVRQGFVNYIGTEVTELTEVQFDNFQSEVTRLLIQYRVQRRGGQEGVRQPTMQLPQQGTSGVYPPQPGPYTQQLQQHSGVYSPQSYQQQQQHTSVIQAPTAGYSGNTYWNPVTVAETISTTSTGPMTSSLNSSAFLNLSNISSIMADRAPVAATTDIDQPGRSESR